jgi:aspartokinase
MKTIADCVEEILVTQPFLEEALSRRIINFSALAEELQNTISEMLRKPVKTGAIMMALRRYHPPKDLRHSNNLKSVLKNLGDITVRSNLVDFTFKNSNTLILRHSKILESINTNIFYGFSRGVHESNLVISASEKEQILNQFKNETMIGVQDNLCAISIALPSNNTQIPGLYYQIFKRFAWEGISLHEVISTTNEFSVLVEDHTVDKAFSAIKKLGNNYGVGLFI